MRPSPELARAAFIDRDGVINEERGYVHDAREFALLPGVVDGLRLLAAHGFKLIVVTNQAGIAKGYYGLEQMQRLHEHMVTLLAGQGVHIDGIYFCPHHPAGKIAPYVVECKCRKPAPGMLLRAAREHGLDLGASVLVGDKASDILAGRAAGVPVNILVRSGHRLDDAEAGATRICDDLLDAARAIVTID